MQAERSCGAHFSLHLGKEGYVVLPGNRNRTSAAQKFEQFGMVVRPGPRIHLAP